jgi:hypothetical protein
MSAYNTGEIFRYNMSGLKFPGLHIFQGMTNSGKTNIVKWILYHYAKKRLFHKIYVFCPTGMIDNPGNYCKLFDPEYVFYEPSKYEAYFDKIYAYQEKNPKRRILLLFDDCIGSVKFKNSKFFEKIAISGRHHSISTFVISQYLNSIPPVMRSSAFTYFVFKTQAQNLETLQDFNSEFKEKKEFRDKVFDYVAQDYHCVRINITSNIKKSLMFFPTMHMDIPFKIEQ